MLSSRTPWDGGSRWWFLLEVPTEQDRGAALPAGGSDSHATSDALALTALTVGVPLEPVVR